MAVSANHKLGGCVILLGLYLINIVQKNYRGVSYRVIGPFTVSVNTANGDHMRVAGDVRVHFKIGKKCSFTHSFVVCERLS